MSLDLRFDLAIVPCTAKKNPHGRTARSLYAGNMFNIMMKHAQQRADKIVIMSAKYGLIDLDAEVSWYNTYLPDLKKEERAALANNIELALLFYPARPRVLSYLPNAYHEFLRGGKDVGAGLTETWNYRRPYAHLNMFQLMTVLANEIRFFDVHPSRR